MGYIKHHAIIVTCLDHVTACDLIFKCRNIIGNNFKDDLFYQKESLVSFSVDSIANDYTSFFIAPDGSKEGWGTSDLGDSAREDIINLLMKSSCDFIEISFGGDDEKATIHSHNKR